MSYSGKNAFDPTASELFWRSFTHIYQKYRSGVKLERMDLLVPLSGIVSSQHIQFRNRLNLARAL